MKAIKVIKEWLEKIKRNWRRRKHGVIGEVIE
jgi:hypothetical protein